LLKLVEISEFICPELLKVKNWQKIIEDISYIKSLINTINDRRCYLDDKYDADIYKINGEDIYKKLMRQHSNGFLRLFDKDYKEIKSTFRLYSKKGEKHTYQMLIRVSSDLSEYQKKLAEFDNLPSNLTAHLGLKYKGADTDFDKLLDELRAFARLFEKGVETGYLQDWSADQIDEIKKPIGNIAREIESAVISSEGNEKLLAKQFEGKCNIMTMPFYELRKKMSCCIEGVDCVDDWCNLWRIIEDIEEKEAKAFLDFALDNKVPTEHIASSYKKTFYLQWVDKILRESRVLKEFPRIPHDLTVQEFKEKDELTFEINKSKIRANVSAQKPDVSVTEPGSAVAILVREGQKKRKQKSVRQIIAEIGELVLVLKPCFLMSPLSVSTYLSASTKFDVVIFDEASQVRPQDALGAIYRGKQLIVVGDSKQMPPSNFFDMQTEVDCDNDDENVSDFESILDKCATIFPQRRLKWHYRSKYEQLISFSNKNFYQNDLITFPSTQNEGTGVGIDYYHVNGVFDRQSKTNRVEADKVVELIYEHFEKYPQRSLGVVAFSVAQQTLIEKLLSKRRAEDSSKEEFFKADRTEPFFIKNLETVQGDERDTIIFSTAYGRGSDGRLLLNFGPVNRAGGERRLNVAVTRAKYNVQLVTSMHYTDIDLDRVSSVGAKLLREYLDYAQNGNIALARAIDVSPFDQFDSEFELEVCEFLRDKGYEVDTQVGCSSFKIDLALKKPGTSDYLLAIECDGAAYHSSKTARDRDRLRQEILESMGWRFYRVWSTDWFRNKNVEKTKLLDMVKRCVDLIPQEEIKKSKTVSFEKRIEEKHFEFPQYKTADVNGLSRLYRGNVRNISIAIIREETPISREFLLKKIATLYGREKVTSFVTENFDCVMQNLAREGIVAKKGFYYVKGEDIPMLRVSDSRIREVKHIAIEELANGLKEIIRQNISITKDGLFHAIVKHLGFSRIGDNIQARLDEALKSIKNEIETDGDMLSLR